MQTLIELYDERPLENVLSVEMFRPERVVYVCPETLPSVPRARETLQEYFRCRGLSVTMVFERASLYDTEAVLCLLRRIVAQYPDCAMDISGGTDDVLFAAGLLCAETDIPVFTYSRRKNRCYNIRGAAFASGVPCDLHFRVEDFFRMAGGSMRTGRVDNAVLARYRQYFDPFFGIYLDHRREWPKIVTFIQKLSPAAPDAPADLSVSGPYVVKGERSVRISAPESALRALRELGFLSDLRIVPDESVSFRFRDEQIRTWLRDVGSVLELYVYQACLNTGLFDDVYTSAVVDWEGDARVNAVTNELDVMAAQGVTPVFISCKTCDVKTEALNELAILRDRFGGSVARAAIVTAERVRAVTRNRAQELRIDVIDLDDLSAGRIEKRLHSLMRRENP